MILSKNNNWEMKLILTEFKEANKLFNTMSDEELGHAYLVNGKISIIDKDSETLYIRVGNQSYISSPNVKAKYRNGLVRLIKKGYSEKWKDSNFILTVKG